jgi:2-hydroxychromene-2-carboxylate isomerase
MNPHTYTSQFPDLATDLQPEACGAIIDERGQEVPITESMIQQACRELAEQERQQQLRGES